ncbi:hypothetical protein K491DRAFT_698700 [Lophiostoma macrostomum CBS 122681]|uniref:ABM domain-containing protein n=1 Tax=Lophiostoma macrostomum CBS 122681 TaxID=1314788 RepID=A0A6A6SQ27_9PLEO|nr:hypothetical protein K491DRAFT_698700 [Lophiostoma macrostomum CBS 122681]
MAITQILQFSKDASSDLDVWKSVEKLIEKANADLSNTNARYRYAIGTHIQENVVVQVTSEWDDVEVYKNLDANLEYASFVEILRTHFGPPTTQFHITSHRSTFGKDGGATANVVEYVQSYFPVSTVTSAFEKQIFDDFVRFDKIYMPGTQETAGLTMGWTQDEKEHADVKGEKARCFVVIRGWESMQRFEESTKTKEFREAIPILYSWNAPFSMVRLVHFEL